MFVRGQAPEPLAPEVVDALSRVQTSTLGTYAITGSRRGSLRSAGRCGSSGRIHRAAAAPGLHRAARRGGRAAARDVLSRPVRDTRSCFGGMVSFTPHPGAVGAVISGSINDVGRSSARAPGVPSECPRDHPHPGWRGDQRPGHRRAAARPPRRAARWSPGAAAAR